MAAASKRKGTISEDDVSLLLHRYTPTTILTLLQEVSQHAAAKIDWKAIVKKSATGITCAREYQMLWRHLAYRDALLEKVETEAEPLDDESDLEYELEAVPAPNEEALSEAIVCAKVLISGSPREPAPIHRISTEAPSAQNISNDKIVRVPSDKQLARNPRLANVTGSLSDSKQMLQIGTSADPLDANGPPKKKRKPWTKEEDMELTTAVQKYGEGNWLDILNGDYKHDRTPVQLSQRWAAICKRQGSIKPANTKPISVASSEERKAAQKAFSMALDMPMTGVSTIKSGAPQQTIQHTPAFGAVMPEVKPVTAPMPLPVAQFQQAPTQAVSQAPTQAASQKASNASNKSRSNSKKQVAQPNPAVGPSSIQAAAIAAGGRIATASTAANLLKAAQSKNVVHIRSRGTGPSKSFTNSKSSNTAGENGAQPANAQHVEPSVTSAPALATQRTQQVHSVSGVAGINPPGHSAAAHLSETQQASSTASIRGPHENMEKDNDSEITLITVEDLFPEDSKDAGMIDSKDADMLEFDRYVAQGSRLNLDFLDKGKTGKDASKDQAVVGGQKDQTKPNEQPSVGNSNTVLAGAPATEKKTIAPVPDGNITSTLTETSGSIGGTGNAGVRNQTADAKPDAPAIAGKQSTAPREQNEVPKDNGMSKNVEVGTEPPAKNQGNTAVNGVSNTNA